MLRSYYYIDMKFIFMTISIIEYFYSTNTRMIQNTVPIYDTRMLFGPKRQPHPKEYFGLILPIELFAYYDSQKYTTLAHWEYMLTV